MGATGLALKRLMNEGKLKNVLYGLGGLGAGAGGTALYANHLKDEEIDKWVNRAEGLGTGLLAGGSVAALLSKLGGSIPQLKEKARESLSEDSGDLEEMISEFLQKKRDKYRV